MNPAPQPAAPIRLLVADDHMVVRTGIVGLVDAEDDMTVIAQADDGHAAVDAFRQHRPDVTLMDLQMPGMDGIEAITAIRAEAPDARIVVLTTYGGDAQAVRALRAGAKGYLLKTMIRSEMLSAIRAAHQGQDFIPPAMAAAIGAHAGQQALSPREIEVLRMVANSGRNKLAAAEMGITEGTIKVHMKNILAKLEAKDRVQAVMIALRRGIIDLDT
ncbi:response regulator transcription factor [Ideonella azotifigens]|uniref:Response regulator transcription factor n=1 Tax=Ideonella azotifigens TaxID=513160 RepID=A0ABN1JL38_9BURK|nr:response regulator transcription factor [Ideonella azotifigens]MCD2339671.1 response regulator transcription factor [Ideonella azotifigens]